MQFWKSLTDPKKALDDWYWWCRHFRMYDNCRSCHVNIRCKIIKNTSLNALNLLLFSKYQISGNLCLSQWPCFLRCGSASACLLGFCVRIYSGTWMSVYFECCIRTYLKDLMPNWKACSVKNMLTNFTWYTNTNLTQAIFVQCKSTYFNAHKFCCVLSETGFSVCIGKW